MRHFLSTVVLLAMALSLAGCELPFGKKGGQPQGQGQMPPPLVSVVELKAKDVTWPQEFQATAAGSRAVDVRARVQGIIQKRLYKEGDFIKAGELMFQLERDTYEAVYEQAVAAWRNAEREWKRVKPLYAANAVSQKERDQALSNYESTSAAVRQAKINLDYCQVVAPVSGFTSKEASTEGNLVSPNSLLTTVNQTDPMYIEFAVAAQERMLRQQLERQGRLRFPEGQIYRARLRLLDGRMYEGEGKVDFIDSQVQATTGVIRCRATFDNARGEIMPGQYVRIFMDGDTLVQALLVPQTAVAIASEGTFVMTVGEGNVAKRTKVELGPTVGNDYLVFSGLKSGDRIVTDGMLKARDGAPVTPAGPDGKAPSAVGAQGSVKQDADKGQQSVGKAPEAKDK